MAAMSIAPFPPLQQQLEFERKGHVCLRNLLPQQDVEKLRHLLLELSSSRQETLQAYKHRVSVLCPGFDSSTLQSVEQAKATFKLKATDDVGFLQMFNLHRKNSELFEGFIQHPLLCEAASQLLSTRRDCLFLKLPGFGVTNWHSDLNMVPIDTNSFITFWIPLQPLSSSDSSLHFASGSHRDFSLPYWQSNKGMECLEQRGYHIATYKNLSLGDLTAHHGWTLHWAPPQPSTLSPRLAWTVSYFADGACMLSTKHARRKFHGEDSPSFQDWYKDMKQGSAAQHKLIPLLKWKYVRK